MKFISKIYYSFYKVNHNFIIRNSKHNNDMLILNYENQHGGKHVYTFRTNLDNHYKHSSVISNLLIIINDYDYTILNKK